MEKYKIITLKRYIIEGVSRIAPSAAILALTIPAFIIKSHKWEDYIYFFFLGALLGTICTVPFTYFVGYKKFLYPATDLIYHVEKIAEKNLKNKINVNKLGYMIPLGHATNDMNNVLREQIRFMSELARKLDEINEKNQYITNDTNEKGKKVKEITKQNKEELKKIIKNLEAVHTFTEELEKQNEKIVHVTGNILAKNKNIQEITKMGREQIVETEESINELNQNLIKVEHQVIQFNEATVRISKMVSLIKDFANQTNLLALNAGVEAERAGELGKGFSVVASHVKKLAQESNKASQDIENLIKEIIQQSNEMEKTIKRERELSEVTTKNFNDTRNKLKEITDYIYHSKEEINSIFDENKELGKYIQDTKERITLSVQLTNEYQIQNEEINHSIDKVSENAEKQKEISESINDISIKLTDTTKKYEI